MSVRSKDMRLAILHAPGDEDLAEQMRGAFGDGDALLAPLGTRMAFGEQMVLLALWTERAAGLEDALARHADTHSSLVVWRRDGAAPSGIDPRIIVLGPEATSGSIAPALRLAEIERGREQEEPAPVRRAKRGFAAAAVGVITVTALGAAAAAAVILDNEEAPLRFALEPAAKAPASASPDLRPTSTP